MDVGKIVFFIFLNLIFFNYVFPEFWFAAPTKRDVRKIECHLTFFDKKWLHFTNIHYGFRQPPVNLTQEEFEKMSKWSLKKRVYTCPVCLEYYLNINRLVDHVQDSHPIQCPENPTAYTHPWSFKNGQESSSNIMAEKQWNYARNFTVYVQMLFDYAQKPSDYLRDVFLLS